MTTSLSDSGRVPTRNEISAEFTWDFSTMYADDAAWEVDVVRLEEMEREIAELQSGAGESAASLLHVLRARDALFVLAGKVSSYARMRKDADGTDPSAQALEARAGSLMARLGAAAAYVEPAILAVPPETLRLWQDGEPALTPYAYYLEQLERERPHVRSAEVESVMAQYSDVTRAPQEAHGALTNVDLTFPTIEDEQGNPVQVSNARYGALMDSEDRRVRRDAYLALHGTYGTVQTTLATTLAATVRLHVMKARLRNYPSALAAAVEPNDIPVDVYHTLLATVRANVSLLHRYVALRKRIMGLDDIHPYDLMAPLVPAVNAEYRYDAAGNLVRAAFEPMGGDYRAGLDAVLANRWVDVYENAGKRSGAYSGGSYATPPFILLNYQNRLDDVYTLAHELGHSLHSYFTRRNQPPITGSYSIFVAEVASTLNEALLTAHLLASSDDPALRKRLLVEDIEGIRQTLLRQTMFAQFELDMHEYVEAGGALTAEWLNRRHTDLVREYHGPEMVIDEETQFEWSRIPHYYFNFYVYQYATGKSAALALARQIVAEGQPAMDRYLRFLKSGSARSPIDLLRDAGVDMTTPEPIEGAMAYMRELLDRLETEL